MPTAACEILVIERDFIDYGIALEMQRELAHQRALGQIPDALFLLEHPHVVTRGVGSSDYSLAGTAHPIINVERGGDFTYHGPGQLVGYPIVHLKERNLLIGPYLRLIEDALIDALAKFGVEAGREKGYTGVWSGGFKLASIGIAVRSWVAYHGFALNVATDLSQFRDIFPCGLQPERMSSMERILGRPINMRDVRKEVRLSFVEKLSR